MLDVCETLNRVHHAQWQSSMRELLGETLQVFAHAAKGGHGRQRWTIGLPTDEGSSRESDKGGYEEGQEGHYIR